METRDLEKTAERLEPKYRPGQRTRNLDEIKLPTKYIKYAIFVAAAGTAISGAALAHQMFPDTIESIIKYLF
ncbi:hypothetical protein KY338_04170 [Candidatus Woesearchaeota archaeon]|nr:hypothetical protein [Candidatus Woesearchaeota archaeon]MBW3005823.1 hypothetical protein [Candidatus Woesearchaeota archaeon]